MVSQEQAQAVKKKIVKEWTTPRGKVVGVGIGIKNGDYVVRVYFVDEDIPEGFPTRVDGVDIVHIVSGEKNFFPTSIITIFITVFLLLSSTRYSII